VANSQSTTLVAAFEDRSEAEKAVDELEQAGFGADDIGYAIRGSDAVEGGMITDTQGAKDKRGALAGMATGAGLGAVLGAAAAMLVPGVGPVIAGGVLTMAFGGAIAGTAIGGIFGAMTGLGVSEEEAKFYEQEFASGKAIIAVKAGPRAAEAAGILRRHGGYDLQNRRVGDIPTEGVFSQP
jgi:hydrogenase maturation factor